MEDIKFNAADIRTCRRCGCTDDKACVDARGVACHWVEWDLCSACQARMESVKASLAELAGARQRLAAEIAGQPPAIQAQMLQEHGGAYLEQIIEVERRIYEGYPDAGPAPEPDETSIALLLAWRRSRLN